MTHPLEQLAPYVDGSLTGPERLEVERHLASCAQCRSEVAVASEARAALRSMPEVEVPTDLGVPALEAMGDTVKRTIRVPRAGFGPCPSWPPRPSWRSWRSPCLAWAAGPRRTAAPPAEALPAGPGRPRPAVGGRLHRLRRRFAPSRGADLGGAVRRPPTSDPQEGAALVLRRPARRRRREPRVQPRPCDACEPRSKASRATPCASLRHRSRAPRPTWRSCSKAPEPISRPTR